PALPLGEAVDAAQHALRPPGEADVAPAVGRPGEIAISGAAYLDPVEFLIGRNGEVIGLAALDIDVPVGQLEIIVAAGQARAVIDSGPGRLVDPVDALPHPFLEVLRVGERDLADAGDG